MTLTSIIPSLRRSIPDPFTRDNWPEFTTTSVSDVTVAGVSLVRLVDWCGTPCVHTAAAVIPGMNGRPSPTALASVIVTSVVSVEPLATGALAIRLDARLVDCTPVLTEARLIGRTSTAHSAVLHLVEDELGQAREISLCRDIRIGDLIAIPCIGATSLHDVRQNAHRPNQNDRNDRHDRRAEDRLEREWDELPLSRCVR
jgi:hypothetical protein